MVGIVGYGAYIPKYRIKAEEIAKNHNKDIKAVKKSLLVNEKSVADIDEDSVTMAVEASLNAIKRAGINPTEIGAIYSGSESHAYAVNPDITKIGEALKIGSNYTGVDLEFACKAGTAAMQICMGLVGSGMIEYGLAIGADTAQSPPGDIIEYISSAGAASFIIGKDNLIVEIESTYSVSSDTPDFWRRELQKYPIHTGKFSGLSYYKHTVMAAKGLMDKTGLRKDDFDHVVFHMPNGKFPLKVLKIMGFSKDKISNSYIVPEIGNTYSASSLLGLTNTLDYAKSNERILLVSYGSGAGSDAFSLKVTDLIEEKRVLAKKTIDYIKNKEYISYNKYLELVGGIK